MTTMINKAFSFELVGQEALVHDSEGGVVVRLTGDEHSVIERLMSGEQIAAPTESEQAAIDRLLQAGIVLDDDPTSSTFSRRRVMQLSAAGAAAAGFAYLSLPSAAAAASGPTPEPYSPGGDIPADTPDSTPLSSNVRVGRDVTSGEIDVRWLQGDGVQFEYRWTLYLSDNTVVGTGKAFSGVTRIDTGFSLPLDGIVRFFVGGTVVDVPVTPPPA